jgi:hypothetical protein
MASVYTMQYEGGNNFLFFYCNRGYMFYTMRRGLSEGHDRCECSGYDYREMDK